MRTRAALLLGALLALAAACDRGSEAGEGVSLEAKPIHTEEGAVCGMLVRDQSAPRGQVVHRDGTRAFLCSIGDLLAYLEVPSPHGAPEAVLVEVMEPDEDPMQSHTGPHPWIPARDAVFVVGVPRRSIMGEPVLVYRDLGDAGRVMEGTPGVALRFEELERWWVSKRDEAPAHAAPSGGHP